MYFALTIDLETDWGGRLLSTKRNCKGVNNELPYLRAYLKAKGIKATFFVSGELVGLYRSEILQLLKEGHELALHGFRHNGYSGLKAEQIREDIKMGLDAFSYNLKIKPKGFRAPQFKTRKELFDIIESFHFKYDSSKCTTVLPFRYNKQAVSEKPYLIGKSLIEIPVSSVPLLRVPFGLLWANCLGLWIIRRLFRKQPLVVMYLHLFDMLENKPPLSCGILIRSWYKFKEADVKRTFEGIVDTFIVRGYKFITLSELCK